ncbi:MAG: glycerophosphodiester phosphodiesterase family protein [Pseudomonadota bacterium]
MTLPESFLARPIAHRGLHDATEGRPENSREAALAAIEHDYGIELDVQLSSDSAAMVFHDYTLDRLTDQVGDIAAHPASALSAIPLKGGPSGMPMLADFLDLIAGRVPLLVEIKDQDRALGPDVGPLEQAVADALTGYTGDVAVMSFNPHAVAEMARLLPDVPRGLVTDSYRPDVWEVSPATLDHLRGIPDYERVGACFVSHQASDLDRQRIAELKSEGATILCWTIRSAEAETQARRVADNVTFEGYLA